MSLRLFFQQLVVVCYLVITAAAFVYTMTRERLLPQPVISWSFGMMAPYQGDTDWNAVLVAEGKLTSGAWQRIDLEPFYRPFSHGEGLIRRYFFHDGTFGTPGNTTRYRQLGEALLRLEQRAGHPFTAIRFTLEQWPRTPEGFEAKHLPQFTKVIPLVTVP